MSTPNPKNTPKPQASKKTAPRRSGFMGRGHMLSGGPTEKARDFKGTLRKLVMYVNPYKTKIIIVFLLALGSTIFSIVGPKILGNATTELFNGVMAKLAGTGDVPFDTIGNILLTALGLYVFSALLSYLQGW
ncbi:MAG: hypothetical protein L3J16_06190, partial [Anaerolineales bacterium]|nr:hypothetical protein [Anaerolineales bacterium]